MSASDLTTSDGLNPARAAGAYGSPLFWAVAAFLILVPLFAAPFLVFQVGAYALILGTIALSLMFLAGLAAW